MKYVIVISHKAVVQGVFGTFDSMTECKSWIVARPKMVVARLDYLIMPLEPPYKEENVTTKAKPRASKKRG